MTDRRQGCAHHRAHRGEFTLPGAEPAYPPDLRIEPSHLDVTLAIDIGAREVVGTTVITVKGRAAGSRSLSLHAVEFLDVSVTGEDVSHTYDGGVIRVTWANGFDLGEERSITVAYRTSHPVDGMIFSVPDDAYPDRPRFAITDNETERARHWLPCIDLPSVRTPVDFHITAGVDDTILANGLLQESTDNGDGTRTAHWKLEHPSPSYLLCVVVGDFIRADDESVDGMEIAYFAPRAYSADNLLLSFDRTPDMIRWMTEKLGNPFPFPKYFQFAVPGIGGAMENISLVAWDDRFVVDEMQMGEEGWLVDVINVHEMAHSYFGDAIVIRDHSHAWLKESWATYMESCWLEDRCGEDDLRYDLWCNAHRYMKEVSDRYARPIVTRVYDSTWSMFDAHLYPGGGFRLHMLRVLLGDDVFWAAVADYVRRYSRGVVETADFRKVLEEHSGRSLERFFDQWFESPGHPCLKVRFEHDKEAGRATWVIDQTQEDPKKGIPLFHFPIVLGWEDSEGVHHTVEVEIDGKSGNSFVVPMEAAPKQASVDPFGVLLAKVDFNPGDAMLRRQLTHGPSVPSRIDAARTLADTGKRAAVAAIEEAFGNEAFWGVRAEMATALGESGSGEAIEALARMLHAEDDPRAMAPIARACGEYRDRRISEALSSWLDRSDIPYFARQAALQALGVQRGADHLDRFRQAAEADGWHGIVQSGAHRALGATRTPEATEYLEGRVAYGQSTDDARPSAVGALAASALWVERTAQAPVIERLTDLTRDPLLRVRQAAAVGLVGLGARSAIGALEAMKATLAAQDHPDVDRWIASLRRAGDERGVAKLDKRLEDLQATIRKLEERLGTLEAKAAPVETKSD